MTTNPAPKPVTRIDMEFIGDGYVRVSSWREGWQEGDAAEKSEMVQKAIMFLLMDYEKQGFTCEMCDANHGRALRGKTVRVDFLKLHDGWHVRKFPAGWTAKTRPISDEIKTDEQVGAAIKWCEEQPGWTVRKWEGGARAFKGTPRPVRDRAGILAMRRRAEDNLRSGYEAGSNKIFYDFAFDY